MKKLMLLVALLMALATFAQPKSYSILPLTEDGSLCVLVDAQSVDNSRPLSEIAAFKGAEGGGMYTTGGRGGKVLYVTRLDDDNAEGSLRWAVSQKYPRIVMFKVSGTIFLQKRLIISSDDLTIAGQSAPGDGICVANYGVSLRANNVIIRFMKFRVGDMMGAKASDEDALGGRYLRNVIIDHCSMSWSTDECCSFYGNENFTLQWSIVTESLRTSMHNKGSHGYGGIWGGKNASFHHNLISNHDSRNPRFDHPLIYIPNVQQSDFRGVVDFRNNVIYNWGNNSTYGGEGGAFNMVNNYYKPGAASRPSTKVFFINAYGSCQDLVVEGSKKIYDFGYPTLYMNGNIMEGDTKGINEDNYRGISYDKTGGKPAQLLCSPMVINGVGNHTTTHSAREAYDLVLKYAGAVIVRDAVDTRASDDARNGKHTIIDGGRGSTNGIIDTQQAAGGFPELKTGVVPVDSDSDGIPDEIEIKMGLDAKDSTDASKIDAQSGYTFVEIYLDSLAERLMPQTSDVKSKKVNQSKK